MNKRHAIGKSLEKRTAKKSKGKVTIGSGNIWFDKEDCKNEDWLFQCKATDKDKYTLKLLDIDKLIKNSKKTERNWAFVVEFNSGNVQERTCYIGTSYEILDEELAELFEYRDTVIENAVKTNGKQITLSKDEMDEKWLKDEWIDYVFEKQNLVLCFLNETDFYKLLIDPEEKIYGCLT